jgi:hypothetical protein
MDRQGINKWAAAKVRDLLRRAALLGAAELQAIARRVGGA